MVIEFAEILHDLELKRAAALPTLPSITLPTFDGRAAFGAGDRRGRRRGAADRRAAGRDGRRRAGGSGRRRRRCRGRHGRRAGDRPRQHAPTCCERLEGATDGHRARPLDARRGGADRPPASYDVAKALVLRRAAAATALRRARRVRADPPLRRGRALERRPRSSVAVRKAFLSLGLDSEPAAAIAARVGERVRTRSAPPTSPIERCRTSSRRSSCSPATCASPSATSSTAPSARCCARGSDASSRPSRAADPGARAPTAARRSWTGADLRERIRFASIGLDLALDETAIERELRRSIHDGIARDDLDAPGRPQRQGADRARRRLLRASPAASCSPTSTRRCSAGTSCATASARCKTPTSAAFETLLEPRRRDRPDRPAPARVRPRRGSPPRSIRPPTSTSTSSASRRSTTAT